MEPRTLDKNVAGSNLMGGKSVTFVLVARLLVGNPGTNYDEFIF